MFSATNRKLSQKTMKFNLVNVLCGGKFCKFVLPNGRWYDNDLAKLTRISGNRSSIASYKSSSSFFRSTPSFCYAPFHIKLLFFCIHPHFCIWIHNWNPVKEDKFSSGKQIFHSMNLINGKSIFYWTIQTLWRRFVI